MAAATSNPVLPTKSPPPRTERGYQEKAGRASRGPASPPATPRKRRRFASPTLTLMHSKHPAADGPPPAPTVTKGKSSEATGPSAAQARGKIKRAEKGWTTVERKRRGGAAKRGRRAEIVDGRGSPRSGPRRRGILRAGGHTSTRGEASRGGGGSEGFSVARVTLFSLFLCFGRRWRRIGAGRKGVCLVRRSLLRPYAK